MTNPETSETNILGVLSRPYWAKAPAPHRSGFSPHESARLPGRVQAALSVSSQSQCRQGHRKRPGSPTDWPWRHTEVKGPNTKTILKNKNKAGGFTLPDFKSSNEATVIKTGTGIDQWTRTQSPEMNPHIYGPLVFNKHAKSTPRGKNSLFHKWCREN